MTGAAPGVCSSTVSCTTLISLIGSLNPTAEGQIDIQPASVIRQRQLHILKSFNRGRKISSGWFPCNLFRLSFFFFLPCHNQVEILVIKTQNYSQSTTVCRIQITHRLRYRTVGEGGSALIHHYFEPVLQACYVCARSLSVLTDALMDAYTRYRPRTVGVQPSCLHQTGSCPGRQTFVFIVQVGGGGCKWTKIKSNGIIKINMK